MTTKTTSENEDGSSRATTRVVSKDGKRYGGVFIFAMFSLLWGLCICTVLLDFFVQKSLPQWLEQLETNVREELSLQRNVPLTAKTDVFSEKDFILIIFENLDKTEENDNSLLYNFKVLEKSNVKRSTLSINENTPLEDKIPAKWILYVTADECLVREGDELSLEPSNLQSFFNFYKLLAYRSVYSPVDTKVCGMYMRYMLNAVLLSCLILLGVGVPMFSIRGCFTSYSSELPVTVICMAIHILFIWICKWVLREIGGGPSYYLYAMLPMSLAPALVQNLLGHRLGVYTAVLLSTLTPILVGGNFQFQLFIQSILYSLVIIVILAKFQGRAQYFACFVGMTIVVIVISILFFLQREQTVDWQSALQLWYKLPVFALANAMVVTALIICFTLMLERFFGIATISKLDELNNMGHVLLKRLHDEAPGTYKHSKDVAELASDAAKKIGANAKLAEACAYFHDIGKLYAPKHYAENLSDAELNPHDACTPEESCAFLREHVKYGMQLAREYHLPIPVQEAVEQHHGNGIMKGFYAKACRDAEAAGKPVPNPRDYSYKNRRPERKEVTLVAIADTCEAAIRATFKRIEQKAKNSDRPASLLIRLEVERLLQEKIDDYQMDCSQLTLEELRDTIDKIVETLCVNYHVRPEYVRHEPVAVDEMEPGENS